VVLGPEEALGKDIMGYNFFFLYIYLCAWLLELIFLIDLPKVFLALTHFTHLLANEFVN